jgi:hypothetical protein
MILKMLHLVTVLKAPAEGGVGSATSPFPRESDLSTEFSHANKAKSMKGGDCKNMNHKGHEVSRRNPIAAV